MQQLPGSFTTLLSIASSNSCVFRRILNIVGIEINFIGLAAEFKRSILVRNEHDPFVAGMQSPVAL
jgi:hypothetical protein